MSFRSEAIRGQSRIAAVVPQGWNTSERTQPSTHPRSTPGDSVSSSGMESYGSQDALAAAMKEGGDFAALLGTR